MVIKDAVLAMVYGPTSRLKPQPLPEIAFAGKSNVGKSSLINALMNRKSLARTSSQPGKTQTLNFYRINQEFYLVDLPGYGYAKASRQAKEAWGKMIERYLKTSTSLRSVYLLIDIRHEPGANDCLMYDWILHSGYEPVIIATKLDKIKKSQIDSQINLIRRTLKAKPGTLILPFSAQTKQGREEIWARIEEDLSQGTSSAEDHKESDRSDASFGEEQSPAVQNAAPEPEEHRPEEQRQKEQRPEAQKLEEPVPDDQE